MNPTSQKPIRSPKQACNRMLTEWFLDSLKLERAEWLPMLQRLAELTSWRKVLPRTEREAEAFVLPQDQDGRWELEMEIDSALAQALDNALTLRSMKTLMPKQSGQEEAAWLFRQMEMALRPETKTVVDAG